MPDTRQLYLSGGLEIDPELGVVRNGDGSAGRLGPVNMKVLAMLVSRRGQLVSRIEILDSVWKHQTVSDDTLTRAMSDIRAELKRVSGRNGHIETVPKRGYRWLDPVRVFRGTGLADTAAVANPATPTKAKAGSWQRARAAAARSIGHRVWRWTAAGLGYLAGFLLLASAGIWLLDRLLPAAVPVVAVLPTSAMSADSALALSVEDRLIETLLELDAVAVLSRAAVDSAPPNPFPYFYFEFDARWLIESELRRTTDSLILALSLVDARTGIVLFETAETVGEPAGPDPAVIDAALTRLVDMMAGSPAPR